MLRHLPYVFSLASAFAVGFFLIVALMSEEPEGPSVTLTLDRSGIAAVERFSLHAKSPPRPKVAARPAPQAAERQERKLAALPARPPAPAPVPEREQETRMKTQPQGVPAMASPPAAPQVARSGESAPSARRVKKDHSRILPAQSAARRGAGGQSAFTQEVRRDPIRPLYRPEGARSLTRLVAFKASPFPYDGVVPRSNEPFLNFEEDGRLGRETPSGRLYWADQTYNDRRVLLHIPNGFDATRPAALVVFFHGHGATLERDVAARQRLPEQVTLSGMNAILVAPQFAVDARDSSAGNFWKPGGMRRFLDEVADRLTTLYGDPRAREAFAAMPVVLVGYSGGFMPTAAVLAKGQVSERIAGVVLLDGLYGSVNTFADWIETHRSAFFLSAYTGSTRRGNHALREKLAERGIPYSRSIGARLLPGSVTIMAVDEEHRDYVTRAWTDDPVSDLLTRMTGVAHRNAGALSAALSPELAR